MSVADRAAALPGFLTDLGWDADAITPVAGHGLKDRLLLELSAANETQVLIVVAKGELSGVGRVALGYSREAPYTLVWDVNHVALLEPARWDSTPGDVPLLEASLEDVSVSRSVLELLERDLVLSRVPSDYTNAGRPHKVLHELLAEAVARLRADVAQSEVFTGETADHSDAEVLRLFHQLLFIRFQEDWGRALKGDRLADLIDGSDLSERLSEVLARYRRKLNSELFAPTAIPAENLPASDMNAVLKALVRPWEVLHLNFSVSRAEVAGRLFQSYLRRTPVVRQTKSAPTLVPLIEHEDQQQRHGAYYTPAAVARYLTAQTLGTYLREHQPSAPADVRVLDPACGSGTFLIAAYRQLTAYFSERYGSLDEDFRQRILLDSLFGADIDERALGLTQIQLLEEADLAEAPLPEIGRNLLQGDSLLSPPGAAPHESGVDWSALMADGKVDVILMNPPFGTPKSLAERLSRDERDALRELYPSVRKWGSDYAYLFLALAEMLLAEDGRLGCILPRTALVGKSGSGARKLMLDRRVAALVDFRGLRLFDHVSAYVCAVSLGGAPSGGARLAVVTDSRGSSDETLDELTVGGSQAIRHVRATQKTLTAHLESGWDAFSIRWTDLQDSLNVSWEPLANPDGKGERMVLHGTQSGDDRALTIKRADWAPGKGHQIVVDGHSVAEKYAPRLVRGREIRPFRALPSGDRLFLPFDGAGQPVTDDGVVALLSHLRQGSGIPPNAQAGDVGALRRPKIVLRRHGREPSGFVDHTGAYVMQKGSGGGLAIVMDEGDDVLFGLEALLHSSIYQWLLRGLASPKFDETVELSVTGVASVPFPLISNAEWQELRGAGDSVRCAMAQEGRSRISEYWEARRNLDEVAARILQATSELQEIAAAELIREG